MSVAVRHVSIRVPWHDTAWSGAVCAAPLENDACIALERIRRDRKDEEQFDASADWSDLPEGRLPPCVRERASFMREEAFHVRIEHPYAETGSRAHQGLEPLWLQIPAYGAPCIPFRWLLRRSAPEIAEREGVPYSLDLEQAADELIPFRTGWVQHGANQRSMIDGFFDAIVPERSLCFLYAKRVPLIEDDRERRVLIGVGRVMDVRPPSRFDGENPIDTVAWESMLQHSIRAGMEDGFLLPYHEALAYREREPRFDPASVVALAPEDGWLDFSYVTEHVSHDVAISSLLACERALRVAQETLPGSRAAPLQWISDRVGELWHLRGPCPGLAAALHAFGVPESALAVRALAPLLTEDEDPWELVGRAMADPEAVAPGLGRWLLPSLCEKWAALRDERRALLRLLSRFALTPRQAGRWYQPDLRSAARVECSDAELLANPYLLYESDREQLEPVSLLAVDHGAFPDPIVREQHPLPAPSALADALDVRRVRALLVRALDRAGDQGHTLRPASELVRAVAELPLSPACPLDGDQLDVYADRLAPTVRRAELLDGTPALQLGQAAEDAELIRRFVERRVGGARREAPIPWHDRLRDLFGGADPADADEVRARDEKAAALAELYASRFSVLVGAAGTGKTTLLKALCDEPAVGDGGVLLLAPTGKARVRLEQSVRRPTLTLAQFLRAHGRYEAATAVYHRSSDPPARGYGTVVVDEASMLTEGQLAALIDGVRGIERFILVGDDRQLPPIGPGRPFIDIVRRLAPAGAFPRVARGYAELLVPRRQLEDGERRPVPARRRADLALAEWFGARPLPPGADEIWTDLAGGEVEVDASLRLVGWQDGAALTQRLLDLLAADLELGDEEERAFELACGGNEHDGWVYFNRGSGDRPGAAERTTAWQVLTPVRAQAHGMRELNRAIQRRFRAQTRDRALSRGRRIPKPAGPEEILYGDRVIATRNDVTREAFPPGGPDPYVANGDIGVVVGLFKRRGATWRGPPRRLKVELASQPGRTYDYRLGEFNDESAPLELAYALTVHRAQGSEFVRTFVVLPTDCPQLSRELLYTALTRQHRHVTVFWQGDADALKLLADPQRSETARRLTNLFEAPDPLLVGDAVLDRGLLHATPAGRVVRSRSELTIAACLEQRGLEWHYERKLVFPDAGARHPAFTIEDDEAGRTVYWEHLTSLADADHAQRWERKRAWYAAHGIVEDPAGDVGGGLLVWTVDDADGSLDPATVAATLDRALA